MPECVRLSVCMCTHVGTDACELLELALTSCWASCLLPVLGIKCRFSIRTIHAFNCGALSSPLTPKSWFWSFPHYLLCITEVFAVLKDPRWAGHSFRGVSLRLSGTMGHVLWACAKVEPQDPGARGSRALFVGTFPSHTLLFLPPGIVPNCAWIFGGHCASKPCTVFFLYTNCRCMVCSFPGK